MEQPVSWAEHLDLVRVVISVAFLVLAWGGRRWIDSQTKINEENLIDHKELHGRITGVDNRLSKLEGAHEANHS